MRGRQRKAGDRRVGERNRLLNALPNVEYASLAPVLEIVALDLADSLQEPGGAIAYAHFPQSAVASVLAADAAGLGLEIVSVGNDGMIGMSLFHHRRSSPHACLVQVAGEGKRVRAKAFVERLRDLPVLQRLLHRYADALFGDAAQALVCHRHHSSEERCARWLLATDDRVDGGKFALTQASLADILADRRPAVSIAAARLKRDGLISYSRGVMQVIDRDGLESAACDCYRLRRESHDLIYE